MSTARELVNNERKLITKVAAVVDDVIGLNQTWQDVTASRAAGVTYTNTTGKPIEVVISAGGANSLGLFFINGSQVTYNDYEISAYSTTSMIVPAGATYKFTLTAGSIPYWMELR